MGGAEIVKMTGSVFLTLCLALGLVATPSLADEPTRVKGDLKVGEQVYKDVRNVRVCFGKLLMNGLLELLKLGA